MHPLFRAGGIAASVILIVLSVASIAIGMKGRGEVTDNLKQEGITGTPDMTPSLTAAAVKEANLKIDNLPDCSVAGKPIDSGARAKCFAEYMRVHALEGTGGRVYAEMGRFLTQDGKETDDEKQAGKDPKTGQPLPNGARNVWVTETALGTALNTSYFASQVSMFSIAMGIALLLTGVGFLVMMLGSMREDSSKPSS
ncbi:MAG: hypothetical protein Q7R41_19300 [Phycisphaerales bacterium]|nr:hypothetical protein [Phycisphaerales bacterium]